VTRKTHFNAVLMGALFCALTADARAQNNTFIDPNVRQVSSFTDVNAQFATMQAELSALRKQVHGASFATVAGSEPGFCDSCISADDFGGGGTWVGGSQIVIVQPHFEHGVDSAAINDFDDSDDSYGMTQFNPDWGFDPAYRVWVGYQRCDGLGARVRYFDFDHSANSLDIMDPDNDPDEITRKSAELSIRALDLEITQALSVRAVNANLSAGVRWGEVNKSVLRTELDNFDTRFTNVRFEGFGPTLGAEFLRPLGCSPLTLVANTRGSLLYGESNFFFEQAEGDSGIETNGRLNEDLDLVYILELQTGVEYLYHCGGYGTLSAQLLFEAQAWGSSVFEGELISQGLPSAGGPPNNDPVATTDSTVGLVGVTLGMVFSR